MSEDPDVEELRADVEQIKAAMGITDRYERTPQVWLAYAAMVLVGAAASQVVVLQRLDPLLHTPIWIAAVGGGSVLLFWWLDDEPAGTDPGKPRASVVFGVCIGLVVPFQLIVGPFLTDAGYLATTAMVLGLIVALIGAAYVLMGNLLRAYRIRVADRAALYAGGLLLIGVGVAIPNVALLHTWGYAAFGGSYVVYALAAYAVLGR